MRYKLTLEYDGSRYAGWQLQKNDRSIQGELLNAAAKVFGAQNIEIYGAGRTDSGVHARGQVAHLEVPDDKKLKPEQIRMRLNDELSHDINILSIEKTHPKFHARHDAVQRTYVYQISKRRDAFGKKFYWWVRDPLDTTLMRSAAAMMVGFRDFASFGDKADIKQSTLVELTRLDIEETPERIFITIRGSHFLWKMVRRIVGVLVEVGRGNLPLETVEDYLQKPSREPARFTAPPSGLYLEKIEY